jgi:Holliday junction resolvase RusA-like endonuclease
LVAETEWRWRVDGVPKGQPRPRAFARRTVDGGIVARVHDAGTAEAWKGAVALAARPIRPSAPIERPVRVEVAFLLPRPRTLYRRRDPEGEVVSFARPDLDNLVKAVLDALTVDGWWRDDALVAELLATKGYHGKDGRPGARIRIRRLE